MLRWIRIKLAIWLLIEASYALPKDECYRFSREGGMRYVEGLIVCNRARGR